jgi:hypothetical protein
MGDSAYGQGRDDAVAGWVASVGHALDYLTLIGAEQTTAIGIRAGFLILDGYLAHAHPHAVNRVVYLDPTGTGRREAEPQISTPPRICCRPADELRRTR